MIYFRDRPSTKTLQNLPLRYILVIPFVFQITVAVGLTGWIAGQYGQKAVNNLATQLREETTLRIKQKLDEYLEVPPQINNINQDSLARGYTSEQDLQGLYEQFLIQSQEFKQSPAIFFGRADGEFIGNANFQPGQPSQLMISGEKTKGAIRFYDVDAVGNPVKLNSETAGFDPRERPWYKAAVKAGKPTWGEIFTYHAYTLMAIPAVTPVYDEQGKLTGVLGNNFFLEQISNFLSDLKVGKTGQTYIIERSGEIVASSTLPQPFTVQKGKTERINILETEDKLLQASAQFLTAEYQDFTTIKSPSQGSFNYQEAKYFLQVSPFQDELGLDWLIVVVMPESDFMAEINASRRNSILLCALALAVAIASGLLTSRWIMRSILDLIEASSGIARGDFSQRVRPSRLRELAILAQCFNRMVGRLQTSFQDIKQANFDLQQSEAKFRCFSENSDAVLWIYDRAQDRSIYVSPAFKTVWGQSPTRLFDERDVFLKSIHPDDQGAFLAALSQVDETQAFVVDYRIIHPDGSIRWIRDRAFLLRNDNGDTHWLGGIAEDITERKSVEQALTQSETQYRLLAENMSDLVCLHDPHGIYHYVSSSVGLLLGYDPEQLIGQNHFDLIHPEDCDRIRQEIRQINDGTTIILTYRIRKKAGDYRWVETVARAIVDEKGHLTQLQTTSRDVTEKIRLQRQLQHDALHDSLTGLPNRNLLMERLNLALQRIHHHDDYQFAVLFLDLDRFKVINDSLGHLAGDEVLIEVAHRLQGTIRSIDLVARLGGDEFVVLVEDVNGLHEAIQLAEKIFASFGEALVFNYQQTFVQASIGIVAGTKRYQQAIDLIRDADIAMYRAKAKGRSCYEIFDPKMHAQALARLQLESDLCNALDREELLICYQPIITMDSQRLRSFEALMRWQHPQQGFVSPAAFIPIAEETQLIVPMSIWLLRAVARQIQQWQKQPDLDRDITRSLQVSVNISVVHLKHPQFMEHIDGILQETQISGKHFIFEITEGVLIRDVEPIVAILRQLRDREIAISIDDFGTGYSSLSYLCDLPINTLKIDKSFVSRMVQSPQNHRVVETILILTRQLGLSSVAEGIETSEQFNLLKTLGCNYAQGYLFGKPERPEVAISWLKKELRSGNIKGREI
ncbi:MAG: EAL domain-containing protein [Jaaginema sp. PMC 1079.18]|nr:EAL domain-containing protein [Jaaginema sp. PMC 1080.18]MEC4851699.1 EAL domain-containing protein [Jaaginema sp. PMC 1079.18]MEC4867229.1 EAL domain-containing protein [Jaaginema sp. PMC 1078.18]